MSNMAITLTGVALISLAASALIVVVAVGLAEIFRSKEGN